MVKTSHHRLMFVVNVDWFFLSHRLPIAVAARDRGFDVIVAAADTGRSEEIRNQGLGFVPIALSRSSKNPLKEILTLYHLRKLYSRFRPDLIHHVTLKPVIYGSIAARLCNNIPVVNAISGLGFAFTLHRRARLMKFFVRRLFKLAFKHPSAKVIFQNPEDQNEFINTGLVEPENAVLIRGSGVDLKKFAVSPEPEGVPIVVFPARLLTDKGLLEFIEAGRIIKCKGLKARFVLVGDIDPGNPATAKEEEVRGWEKAGIIEWWGFRTDMEEVFKQSSIVVLPSYREGLPKALLEAAAAGRPIVSTDVRGCREIVKHNTNGLLVPPSEIEPLANAIETLLLDSEKRQKFGAMGREIAEESFSVDVVVEKTLRLYSEMLGQK